MSMMYLTLQTDQSMQVSLVTRAKSIKTRTYLVTYYITIKAGLGLVETHVRI